MPFLVTQVSRGDIRLTDGVKNARILGEGLLPTSQEDPSYVFYLNSIEVTDASGTPLPIDEKIRGEIIDSINAHFSGKGYLFEFE